MAKIRFTHEFTLANALRPRTYRRGDTLECGEATARRYIRRGVAERVDVPRQAQHAETASGDSGDDSGDGDQLFADAQPGGEADQASTRKKPAKSGGKKPQRLE